jgi:hypothetical protein
MGECGLQAGDGRVRVDHVEQWRVFWTAARLIDQIVEGAMDGSDGISGTTYQKQVCIKRASRFQSSKNELKHPLEYVSRRRDSNYLTNSLHQQINHPSRNNDIRKLLTNEHLLFL